MYPSLHRNNIHSTNITGMETLHCVTLIPSFLQIIFQIFNICFSPTNLEHFRHHPDNFEPMKFSVIFLWNEIVLPWLRLNTLSARECHALILLQWWIAAYHGESRLSILNCVSRCFIYMSLHARSLYYIAFFCFKKSFFFTSKIHTSRSLFRIFYLPQQVLIQYQLVFETWGFIYP